MPQLRHARLPPARQERQDGRGYAAFAKNCGYYPHSGSIVPQFAADLTAHKTTPGAIQFAPNHPIPEPLIWRLIDARLAEIAAKGR